MVIKNTVIRNFVKWNMFSRIFVVRVIKNILIRKMVIRNFKTMNAIAPIFVIRNMLTRNMVMIRNTVTR